jgi:hypothetical protein
MSVRRGVVNFRKRGLFGLVGQSTLEYAVLIACVVSALLAMQIYIKRGTQGRLRQASDSMGEQYAPNSADSSITTTTVLNVTIDQELVQLKNGTVNLTDQYGLPIYGINSTTNYNETTGRSGNEKLGQLENKLF